MKVRTWLAVGVAALLTLSLSAQAPLQKDATGCQDHPLFNRMEGYWIHGTVLHEFDAHAFPVADNKTESVEGRLTTIRYYPQASWTTKPSPLQILRNYENAVKAKGGVVVWAGKDRRTFRLNVQGQEVWVDLAAEFTGKYFLTIVERQAMKQDIVANAAALAGDIRQTGHVAVYGIYFDTGKAELKPESDESLAEIAKMLGADPGLKLHVVGHTDSTGLFDANLRLSQGRAEAVVNALVQRYGIAAARLRAHGVGPLAPVASNGDEEGKAKNRRVELVKQ